MIKGDHIEYEFDLMNISGVDVIENFKQIFGTKLTNMNINYEIHEITSDKMTGGDGSISTFPYNKFEEAVDNLVGKKKESSLNSHTLYDLLFSDFKRSAQVNVGEKIPEKAQNDGYYENVIKNTKNKSAKEETAKLRPDNKNMYNFLTETLSKIRGTEGTDNIKELEKNEQHIESEVESVMKDVSTQVKKLTSEQNGQTIPVFPKQEENNVENVEEDTETETGRIDNIIKIKLLIEYKNSLLTLEKIKKGR